MKWFSLMLVFGFISTALWAQENKAAVKKVEIIASKLNARSGPTKDHHILGTFQREDVVNVYAETADGWFETDCPKTANVYIFKKYIRVEGNEGEILGENVNGRSGPSEDTNVLFKFGYKTKVDVLGLEKDFVKIAPPPQARSYIYGKFTRVISEGNVSLTTINNNTQLTPEDKDLESSETSGENPTEIPGVGFEKPEGNNLDAQKIITNNDLQKANTEKVYDQLKQKIILDEDKEKYEYKGWVRRLGRVIGRKATHALFVTQGNDVVHLISNDTNIKLEDYANKYIGINGINEGKEKRSKVDLVRVTEVAEFAEGVEEIKLLDQKKN